MLIKLFVNSKYGCFFLQSDEKIISPSLHKITIYNKKQQIMIRDSHWISVCFHIYSSYSCHIYLFIC